MGRNVPCDHIVIYEAKTGVDETLDYPGFLDPMEVGHDLVRIEVAGAAPDMPSSEESGDRVTDRDWPFLEFDLSVAAARQLAEGLLREAEKAERAPEVT